MGMRTLKFTILFAVLLAAPAIADDNIADCEIVVQQPVSQSGTAQDLQDAPPAMIATYLPAENFIFSVFDAKPGHIKTAQGKDILALMCVRSAVLPTQFDLKLIKTGVPLFLSQNFDAVDSDFMAIQKTNGAYTYDYSGPELSDEDSAAMQSMISTLNAALDLKQTQEQKQ